MRANGQQLHEITRLIEAGAILPVIDRVCPFESTNEALTYVEAGLRRAKSSSRSSEFVFFSLVILPILASLGQV